MSGVVAHRTRGLIQTTGLLRKEVAQTLRQPQLLLLLVAGPFVILLIFGFGYNEDQLAMRTRFVGPADSIYQTALTDHEELLSAYLVSDGYSTDLVQARRDLREGTIDLVVVFPTDATDALLAGEQAPIQVLHDKIDPIQITAVEIASRMAIGEVNSTIWESLVDTGLDGMRSVQEALTTATELAEEFDQAVASGDQAEADRLYRQLDLALAGAQLSLSASSTVVSELDIEGSSSLEGVEETAEEIQAIRDDASRRRTGDDSTGTPRPIGPRVAELVGRTDAVTTLPPSVVVRPFIDDVSRLSQQRITPTAFFAPATIALLLAHLGVTFAAMSVVADRRLGVFEAYRVAPIRAAHIVVSKYLAFVLLGGIVGAGLLAAVVLGLDVPLLGSLGWVAGIVALVVLASVGLGLIVSALARTDSQAVQYAMLVLFAGLFFGGFFLPLDSFLEPVRVLSAVLPVTYGIEMLHDVMLRGLRPEWVSLGALAGLTVAYGVVASWLMRRQLRAR